MKTRGRAKLNGQLTDSEACVHGFVRIEDAGLQVAKHSAGALPWDRRSKSPRNPGMVGMTTCRPAVATVGAKDGGLWSLRHGHDDKKS